MCGCDCCQNSNPTCFNPELMRASGECHGWVCKCSCGSCIARVIRGATNTGYLNGVATNAANQYAQGRADAAGAADTVIGAMPTGLWINANAVEAQAHKRYVRDAIAALGGEPRE